MKKIKKGVLNMLLLLLIIILNVGCDGPSFTEQIGEDIREISDEFNKGYKPEKREVIGMTATLIYLQETNQLDSVTIDFHRLLQIQDSVRIMNVKN